MKSDYFDWHRDQTSKVNSCNVKDYKFLVLRCSEEDKQCGGVADRLKNPVLHCFRKTIETNIFDTLAATDQTGRIPSSQRNPLVLSGLDVQLSRKWRTKSAYGKHDRLGPGAWSQPGVCGRFHTGHLWRQRYLSSDGQRAGRPQNIQHNNKWKAKCGMARLPNRLSRFVLYAVSALTSRGTTHSRPHGIGEFGSGKILN